MKILLFVCTLWSYIDPSVQHVGQAPTIDGEMKIGHMAKGQKNFYRISCSGTCEVEKLFTTFSGKGDVDLQGSESSLPNHLNLCYDKSCFCKGDTNHKGLEHCSMRTKVSSNELFITMRAFKESHNVSLHHRIGGFLSITPYQLENAGVQRVGHLPEDDEVHFIARCNGTCNVKTLYVTFSTGAVKLYGSESPPDDAICPCICKGSSYKMPEECLMLKEPSKSTFYITIKGYYTSLRVELGYQFGNLLSIRKYSKGSGEESGEGSGEGSGGSAREEDEEIEDTDPEERFAGYEDDEDLAQDPY